MTFEANAAGHLAVDGHDVVDLVGEFGAPLWIVSARRVRENHDRLRDAFVAIWPDTRIVYASKANPSPAIVKTAYGRGAMVDAVTAGHLRLLERAGVAPADTVFNGNAKTPAELAAAIARGIGVINVDSLEEMELLADVATASDRRQAVCVRVADAKHPAASADDANRSSEAKFGMDRDDLVAAARLAHRHRALELAGTHHHLGFAMPFSAAIDAERNTRRVERVFEMIELLRTELPGWAPRIVNMGGGYRVGHPDGFGPGRVTDFPTAAEYAMAVAGTMRELVRERDLPPPQLLLEAGGYVVADAACLVALAGLRKTRTFGGEQRDWVFVEDTSAYHFVRRLMQDFYYRTVVANRMFDPPAGSVTIAGPVCTADDLARDVALPRIERDDLIAVLDQGAYCESVTSDYCAVPTPATLMVDDGRVAIIRRRETVEDIANRFDVPAWL